MKIPLLGLLLSAAVPLLHAVPPVEKPATVTLDGVTIRKLSPVPAPGVHPRIFFSPEDLPELRRLATTSPARQAAYAALRKEVQAKLDNPASPEGRILALIASGKTPNDAQFAAATDLSRQLSLAAMDAQITNDEARGKLLGRVLSAYGENLLRTWQRKPDPVGLHNSWDSGFCLAYDFLAPWMDEPQRAPARKFIAKMMDGINIFTSDWPAHMRMWNWAGLHVYQGWGSLAIEGEEGWNPKLWNQAQEVARDFCRYNIHKSGALTEDLTYFTLGFQGSGLVMMAMAKRGGEEVWAGGSNISKLRTHLVNQLHPWGKGFMSHQDGTGDGFYSTWLILKYMYPTDPLIDYAWRQRVGEDYSIGGAANDAATRSWLMVLFNTESLETPVPPTAWNLPTTYFCPIRSYLVTRTGWDANALKLDFEAKTDYPTVGHNHADASNFTFAAFGREWATEFGYHGSAGQLHNNVLIDGRSESPWPEPGGRWVDLVNTPEATIGVSDASHAYTWRWSNSGYGVANTPPPSDTKWEIETLPDVREFVREQVESGKGRQSIFEHHGPVLRGEWNPVEKAFRTAALVRGPHPYTFIIDDIRKDSAVHLYQWAMFVPDDLEVIRAGGRWVVLGAREMPADPKNKSAKPQPDKRRLLVQLVDVDLVSENDGLAIALEPSLINNGAFTDGKAHQRLVIPTRSIEPRFKVLLYPHMEGDPLPDALWNEDHNAVDLIFPGQTDRWTFASAAEGRTAVRLERDGKLLAAVDVPPAAPQVLTAGRVFTDRISVELSLPGPGQEIRYTLDGSEPTAKSPHYAGPFPLDRTTTVKAATFAPDWAFGKVNRSAVTEAAFTRTEPLAPVAHAALEPGLKAVVHRGFWNELPDFSKESPLFQTGTANFTLPAGTPGKGFGVEFSGYVRIPADGVYTFGLRSDDASKLWIGDQLVVDNDGAHVVRTRTGQIALKAGLHPIRVGHCDMALALGTGKGDGHWAFEVTWAPQGAALGPIPDAMLQRDAGLKSTAPVPPKIAAAGAAKTTPGLVHTTYDRSAEIGTAEFFATPADRLRHLAAAETITSPDSAPGLLHVYEGYLRVPHAGTYDFQLAVTGVGELTFGETVINRVGSGDRNLERSVELPEGLVPFTLKLGTYTGPVRWKGPGMDWQSLTVRDLVRQDEAMKPIWKRDLLGHWSAGHIEDNKMVNLAEGAAAGPLSLPEGTQVITDPEVGKALRLDHSSMIRLEPTGILANELTVSFRVKSDQEQNAILFRYGYAHFGVFANISKGDVVGGGGGVFGAASTQGGKLKDGKWHTVTLTYGGEPIRKIQLFLDGKLQAEGRSKSPCLTDNLEFLKDFTGDLADIRLFNRVLSPAEIGRLE